MSLASIRSTQAEKTGTGQLTDHASTSSSDVRTIDPQAGADAGVAYATIVAAAVAVP